MCHRRIIGAMTERTARGSRLLSGSLSLIVLLAAGAAGASTGAMRPMPVQGGADRSAAAGEDAPLDPGASGGLVGSGPLEPVGCEGRSGDGDVGGLVRAIEVVSALCEEQPQAPGLGTALAHLLANDGRAVDRADDHTPSERGGGRSGSPPGAGNGPGAGTEHGTGRG
jgi:hypothetical protein